jgi:uncharacterized protein (DUF58 family)
MTEGNDVESFLDEDFLRKLEKLKVMAQKGIRGPHRGEHISWRSGASLDFLDYRKYQAGDDFRYIDWNVYGRLDKLFIKLFRAEEDLTIHFLIDMSRSMREGNPPKHLYAKKVVAALCYIGLAGMDRVGVTSFTQALGASRSPERGKQVYLSVLKYLLSLRPEGTTDLNASLKEYASICKRPGVVIVLSDLLDPKGFEEGVETLISGRFDVTLIQMLDRDELSPPYEGYLTLNDVETGQSKKMTIDGTLLELHRKKIRDFLKNVKDFCFKNGVDYYFSETRTPFEDFLLDYLSRGSLFH